MSNKYYQTFIVRIRFRFPIDMLRYDSCFPSREVDAGLIERSFDGHAPDRTVQIARFVDNKHALPTVERWESFGCKVSKIEIH